MDNDDFHIIPGNISNVADMLEYGGISWAEYQQSIPYPGFAGFNFSNQQDYANMYVRKHDPLILYENIMNNATRNRRIVDFPQLDADIANKTLPQWGTFLSPSLPLSLSSPYLCLLLALRPMELDSWFVSGRC
jgi:acid phosphatase